MRRRTKVLVVVSTIVLVGVFFFAPIVYWFSTGPYYEAYPHPSPNMMPVYRSLG